ncbi:MAG: caspase family protein [Inquilinus sp.]|uniref:caspase family protein n=1 Tax=Inquilinus sp. TaxID=1932117 RepID=UPI003F405E95
MARADRRVALVIGNSAYQHVAQLPNPANDSTDIAAALERIGFQVTLRHDLDYAGMRSALRDFGRDALGADMALIYFAGHGLEIDNHNYLVPVDARLATDLDVEFEAIPMELLLNTMVDVSVLRLVLLDACRDNPFVASMRMIQATRSIGRGLSRVEPAVGTLVGYAAKEGTTAEDGDNRNSPYTTALLAHLEESGIDIQFMFRKVRDSVLAATRGRQEPYVYGSLPGREIYLRPPVMVQDREALPSALSDATATEIAFWDSVKNSDNPQVVASYLRRYPDGKFKELAELQLEGLSRRQTVNSSGSVAESSAKRSLTESIQRELRRVGCDPGSTDGIWGQRSREALRRFVDHSKVSFASLEPSPDVLTEVMHQAQRVCPQAPRRSATRPQADSQPGAAPPAATVPVTTAPAAAAPVVTPPAQACRPETLDECRVRARAAGARPRSGFCRTPRTICN